MSLAIDSAQSDREIEDRRWSTWMAAAQRGDSDRYEALLAELESTLRGFLFHLVGAPELVDDCLQECLLAIHRARHTYDPKRPFKPWAFALARYKTIDVIRRRSTQRRHESSDPDGAPEGSAAPQSDADLDLDRILGALESPYREAVMMTKLMGYTLNEAAAAEGVSKAAMASRVHRGLRALRRLLERELS